MTIILQPTAPKHPPWIKVRYAPKNGERETTTLLRHLQLTTICEEGLCPNRHECFGHGVATFMLLGKRCTRNCHYCHVQPGKPLPPDPKEPERVASAVRELKLQYVVITSVNRDDLPDQGVSAFVRTVEEVRRQAPGCAMELLIPDLKGDEELLKKLVDLRVEVLSHNIETVEEFFPKVRPQGNYQRSLDVLSNMKKIRKEQKTKSGLMVGLGENEEHIRNTLRDLQACGCDFLTIGQYLQPTVQHWAVQKYYDPAEFLAWKEEALALGFTHVESGPLVRSSYRADRLQNHLLLTETPKAVA